MILLTLKTHVAVVFHNIVLFHKISLDSSHRNTGLDCEKTLDFEKIAEIDQN